MIIPNELSETISLNEHFINDMNLRNNTENENVLTLFYSPQSLHEEKIINKIGFSYTCDCSFLQTTSEFVSLLAECYSENDNWDFECCEKYNSYCDSKLEEDYHYLCIPDEFRKIADMYSKDIPYLSRSLASLDNLNTKSWFLQGWSMYNVGSPFMALLTPIFFAILPFFFLKLAGIPITISSYWTYLKQLLRGHTIGQLLDFSSSSGSNRIYIIISVVFYIVNIVQNIMQCSRFLSNQKIVIERIRETARECERMNERITQMIGCIRKLDNRHNAYTTYLNELEIRSKMMEEYLDKFHSITKILTSNTLTPPSRIGDVLSVFYRIHREPQFKELMHDCYDIMAYQNILINVSCWYPKMCRVEWDENKHSVFEDFLPITILDKDEKAIKNTVDLSENWIITGKNASGKTTVLRSLLWNQHIAQQSGICFSKRAVCGVYDTFHCYLNIPDSFSRDSLFQAEARRCLEVIEAIHERPERKHLCIFDELYSGTNPIEAISGSVAYIRLLEKNTNVKFLLTTHFHSILKFIGDKKHKTNRAFMRTENNHFTYQLEKGVNRDFGAIEVFEQLGYSNKFIQDARRVLKKVNKQFG